MPPEDKKKKLNAIRKKLSARSRERRYNNRLLQNMKNSGKSLGSENFKLTKEIIGENTEKFRDKYTNPDSAFQQRLSYLKENLSEEEFQASPEYKLNQIVSDFIDKGINEYSQYAAHDYMYGDVEVQPDPNKPETKIVRRFAQFMNRADEAKHLKNSMEYFNQLEQQIDETMNTEFGKTEAFQEFYSDMKDFVDETKRITSGGLVVPANRSGALYVKLTEEKEEIDPKTNEKVTRKVIKEPVLHPVKKRKNKDSDPDEYYTINYRSFKDEPLFAHEPCPEDIAQGQLGDCYFIATMSAVVENNPDYIRNCMKDNGDGTVTVRLFDEEQREIYTTVNKTVPMLDLGKGKEIPAYGKGALWVSIMEKAYVQSGIAYTLSESFAQNQTVGVDQETGKPIDRNSYEEIIGGRTEIASINILGTNITEAEADNLKIDIPEPVLNKLNGKHNKKLYTDGELDFFDTIKKSYEKGDVLTAGIDKKPNHSDETYEESKGLPPGHAYSIIGTSVDEKTGRMFIKIRNPHMAGGRAYDAKGHRYHDPFPENPGESLIELRDFTRTFKDCYSASYRKPFFQQRQAALVNDDKTMYADAVKQACDEIIATDPAYVLTNSQSFRDFKKAAIALKAEFKKESPSHEDIDRKLQEFFTAAKGYKDSRDTRNQKLEKDSRERSVARYRLADAVGHFEEIYRANQVKDADLQYVDFDMCKEQALDMDLEKGFAGISQAKDAALKGIVKEEPGQVINAQTAKQKINDVEANGLERIENGLKNYNKSDLIQGLCEVIASRSCRAHESELRPKDIERHLSNEAIDRVRNNFGKKLEFALSTINKDDFQKIMKSGDIGKGIASKVTEELARKKAPAAEINKVKDNDGPQLNA